MLLGGACCSRSLSLLAKRSVLLSLRNSRRHFQYGSGRNEIGENANCFGRVAVEKAYQIDRLSGEKWFLIYNDVQGVTRSRFPQLLLLMPFGVILYDQLLQDGTRWREVTRSIQNYSTWMPFMVLPLISLCILFRIRQSCILRIYQSRMNPTDFLAVAPRLVVGNRTIRFMQGDAEALTHEGDRSAMANIFMGNLKIKGSRFLSDNDLYRANFFRGCMLNELAARPPPESL